jgi:predicted chitinase
VDEYQRNAWRKQAAQHLYWLVRYLPDPGATEADELADNLLRALSNQGNRPPGRDPYRGLFLVPATASIQELRSLAANGIKVFVEHITTPRLSSQDAVVDAVIRRIKVLPDRPANRLPYEGLFPKTFAITADQIQELAPYGDPDQIRRLTPHLNATMTEFEINTPLRRAHFLAQVAHESGEFNYVEEIASGAAYEYRSDLGNTRPGDGVRYKGRGLIQITGRFNYRAIGESLGVDLISNPTRLADDDLAARSAGWFWDWKQLNPDADRDDFETITYVINGGYNGYTDRLNKLQAAKRVLGI